MGRKIIMHNISLLNKKLLIAILFPLLVLLGASYTHAADRGDAGYREGDGLLSEVTMVAYAEIVVLFMK